MKVVRQLPDGRIVDAETSKDLTDLFAAFVRHTDKVRAGHLGGIASAKVNSAAKREASRLNGKRGGRPRKK